MNTLKKLRFSGAISSKRPWVILAGLILFGSLISEARAAVVTREVLKSYFEKGDKPTEAQFGALIDSVLNLTDDRHLLGLKQYDPSQTYLGGDALTPGTVIDSSTIFGPAAGLADIWSGRTAFLGLSFTEGSSSDAHYGYLQIQAALAPDLYPMQVQYLVYEDQAGAPLVATFVPEPTSLLLGTLGSIGLIACYARTRAARRSTSPTSLRQGPRR